MHQNLEKKILRYWSQIDLFRGLRDHLHELPDLRLRPRHDDLLHRNDLHLRNNYCRNV